MLSSWFSNIVTASYELQDRIWIPHSFVEERIECIKQKSNLLQTIILCALCKILSEKKKFRFKCYWNVFKILRGKARSWKIQFKFPCANLCLGKRIPKQNLYCHPFFSDQQYAKKDYFIQISRFIWNQNQWVQTLNFSATTPS